MSNFEDRLLHELQSLVLARPAGGGERRLLWRGPRLVVAGGLAAVVAAAIVGLLFLSAGAQSAYAVTKNSDGTVTVEIDSLSDAAGLQSALQAAGVKAVVQYLPEGKVCQQPWFTPLGHPGVSTQSGVAHLANGGVRFTMSADIPADATVVIETQTGPGNEVALGISWAESVVPSCQVVDAPAGSGPLGGPPPDASTQTGQP